MYISKSHVLKLPGIKAALSVAAGSLSCLGRPSQGSPSAASSFRHHQTSQKHKLDPQGLSAALDPPKQKPQAALQASSGRKETPQLTTSELFCEQIFTSRLRFVPVLSWLTL